jgi:hypothetical protein
MLAPGLTVRRDVLAGAPGRGELRRFKWRGETIVITARLPATLTRAADPDPGAGIEDWEWNLATLWAGIPHLVVADAVHLLRVKATGSLGAEHIAMGLLPRLPPGAVPRRRTGR